MKTVSLLYAAFGIYEACDAYQHVVAGEGFGWLLLCAFSPVFSVVMTREAWRLWRDDTGGKDGDRG